MKTCRILFWFYATALISLLPIPISFAHSMGGFGGGGHPGVGAISFEIGAVEEARKAAGEIAEELRS